MDSENIHTFISAEEEQEGFVGTVDERFRQVYDRYHQKIYNYIVKSIANPEDAADLLQEVFLLFYDRLPKLDTSSTRIEAWLLRVARNIILSYSRTRSKQPQQQFEHREAISQSMIEEELLKKDMKEKFDEFLMSLNERERTIFILHKLEGVRYKDLIEIFGISHRTLKRIVHGVMMKLKNLNLFE
ncbi:MAG: sigma-70 family RNA polymerase sigma factor [Candidatus Hydrogenedentota bacterium]|nr:MAG: sigma-70 family RNA polymerase sigma factor [Candidatus Hydrogenedentota bacterium]